MPKNMKFKNTSRAISENVHFVIFEFANTFAVLLPKGRSAGKIGFLQISKKSFNKSFDFRYR